MFKVNKRVTFIVKLYMETHLSALEAENLVKDIPEEFLNEAIRIYEECNVIKLKLFIQGLKL